MKQTGRIITVFTCLSLFVFAIASHSDDKNPGMDKSYSVNWKGKLMKVHRDGDASPRFELEAHARREGAFAIGPLAGLRGEITVLDGKPFIARAVDDEEEIAHTWDHKGPFLVYGQVAEWDEVEITDSVRSIADLEAWLARNAGKHGIDVKNPFPFKIECSDAEITYHIISNQEPGYQINRPHRELMVGFKLNNEPATLIGVYSTQHAGVFTHHGSSTHIHMVSKDEKHSGHVEQITLGKNTKLYLPSS